MWSRPVPIQLLYQQLTHSGNFFHNAAVLIERRYDDETNEEDEMTAAAAAGLYVWDSIDLRLIGESRLNQVILSSLSTYWYLHLLITFFLSINFIIIIMKVTDT